MAKKVPLILPLFTNNYIINNKLEPDFKLKANFLNNFFADNFTPIQNNSVISKFIERELINKSTSIVFNDESILKIVRALYVNKAHSHDDISVWMIRLCNKSFIQAISLIYKKCINSGIFPNTTKCCPMLSQLIRRVRGKLLTITDQFYFDQFWGLFLIYYFFIIFCLMGINQNSDHLIHVNISSYQLYMIYMCLLTVTHLVMSEVYF